LKAKDLFVWNIVALLLQFEVESLDTPLNYIEAKGIEIQAKHKRKTQNTLGEHQTIQ
jgi:hypothetical protein